MTNSASLETVARAIAAASPTFEAEEQRIVKQTFSLLALGQPVPPSEIAKAAAVPERLAEDSLRAWPGVFWDDQDRVVGFWGLAIDRLEPTHRIEVNGQSVYGWCAWDTLFLTHMLGTETHVESADPVTGDAVRLTVTAHGVRSVEPPEAVVSFLLPDGPFGPDTVESFCHFVYFFASRESAERWVPEHPGTFLLSVDEAFELGRLTNGLRWGQTDRGLT